MSRQSRLLLLLLTPLLALGLSGLSFAAQPQSFQYGTVALPAGAASVTVSFSPVVMAQAFLSFNSSFAGNEPGQLNVAGQIVSATQAVFTRGRFAGAPAVLLKWNVAEFSSGVAVQRGTADVSPATAVTVTLPAPVVLSRSFPLISYRSEGVVFDCNDFIRARLVSTTQLELSYNCTNPEGVVEWEVVDYTGAAVTSGDLAFNTGNGSRSATVPAFNPASTWLLFSYKSDSGTDTNISQKMVRGLLSGGNTLTFDRDSTGQAMDLTWFLVEFSDGTSVQSGNAHFNNADLSQAAILSPALDPARTLVTAGGIRSMGGKTNYTIDDNPGLGTGILEMTAPATITLTRGISGAAADLGWFAVQFNNLPTPTPTWSPTKTFTGTNTFTPTMTLTLTSTPTLTPTPSFTGTSTFTPTLTPSFTPTSTFTFTSTHTPTNTLSATPTSTFTNSSTFTSTETFTFTPTDTFTFTSTPTPTYTMSSTSTSTFTPTDTLSFTPTATFTFTSTHTPTYTMSSTSTSTFTPTDTLSFTPTDTFTFTSTHTPTYTMSSTSTSTFTPTDTLSFTPTATFTFTSTHTPTYTMSSTSTSTFTPTDTLSFTPTATLTFTSTHTPTHTMSSTPTSTLTFTLTSTPTDTFTFTSTHTPTPTVSSTSTLTPTDTLSFTSTASFTSTSTPSFTATRTFTVTSSFTPTPTFTLTLSFTPTAGSSTFTPSFTSTASWTPTATGTLSHTLTPTDSATPTDTPTSTETASVSGTVTFTPAFTPSFTPAIALTAPAGCGGETFTLFDPRGERVRRLCGTLPPMDSQTLTLTVSAPALSQSGLGASLAFNINGQTAVVWDGRDDTGRIVPNSFYHLVLVQSFTDGGSALRERDFYFGPQGSTASVQLKAQPNMAYAGGTILISASFGTAPADERSIVKIFTVGGERVRSLKISQGQASWDLTNDQGQDVASGIYLIGLDGVDAATGTPSRKTIKVVVLR